MIEACDADFHPVMGADAAWAEVFSVGFTVPEANINVRVYLLFRPQFGVVQSSVTIVSRDALAPWQSDYADFRPHLPAPASLTDFTLENGLSLETMEANRLWRLRFDDKEGTEFDVVFDATMPAFSPFDSGMNPLARPAAPGAGMIEQTGRMHGTLQVRGKAFTVDCGGMMNHGWGLRRDRHHHGPTGANGVSWLHAYLADGTAFFAVWMFALANPQRMQLLYGYSLEGGKVNALTEGQAAVTYDADRYPVEIVVEATDNSGQEHRLKSYAVHRSLWACWPNMTTFCVYPRWVRADGCEGYGDILHFVEIGSLTAVNNAART